MITGRVSVPEPLLRLSTTGMEHVTSGRLARLLRPQLPVIGAL